MPNNVQSSRSLFGAAVALSRGSVIRASANNVATLALADSAPHIAGTLGVAPGIVASGYPFHAILSGEGPVLCEVGLTLAAGDKLFVSATVAGRATNVQPANPQVVGTVKDISAYAATRVVTAAINTGTGNPSASPGGAGAVICLDAFVEAYDHQTLYEQFVQLNDGNDRVIARWIADFDRLNTANINAELNFYASIGTPATLTLVIGGTPTNTAGTVVATQVVGAVPNAYSTGPQSIVKPVGAQVVKVVMNSGADTRVEGIFVTFSDQ